VKRAQSVAIAGAGLSGFAVAVALRRRRFAGPIRIVDRKAAFSDDRTWCWWNVPGVPFADRASHAWNRWRIADGTVGATMQTAAHAYVHLRGSEYYAACLAELAPTDTVIVLGEAVVDIADDGRHPVLRTASAEYPADLIIDARGKREPTRLRQHFAGMHIATATPAFDARTVTLMNFDQTTSGMEFVYVLPFSSNEALVEHTVVDAATPNPAARRLRPHSVWVSTQSSISSRASRSSAIVSRMPGR